MKILNPSAVNKLLIPAKTKIVLLFLLSACGKLALFLEFEATWSLFILLFIREETFLWLLVSVNLLFVLFSRLFAGISNFEANNVAEIPLVLG